MQNESTGHSTTQSAAGRIVAAVATSPVLGTSLERVLEHAVQQGIRHASLEMMGSPQDTPDLRTHIEPVLQQVKAAGLEPVALFTNRFAPTATLDRERVELKHDTAAAIHLLDLLSEMAIPRLGITPPALRREPRIAHEERFAYYLELILSLRFEAEMRGLGIDLVVGTPGFLTSPTEARDLIDRCNSSCVGASLAVHEADAFSDPTDWVSVLGRRLTSLRILVDDAPLTDGGTAADSVSAIRLARQRCPLIVLVK